MANKNVELLRGEPKTAILKLAVPILVSMLFTALYNIVDGIWIAGLGEAAIAGIGFVTPIFMLLTGIGGGLASGATSSISRAVGAKNHENATKFATHSILIFSIVSILLTLILLIIQGPLLAFYGASGQSLIEANKYATPVFLCVFAFMFSIGGSGILRGEGDMKRAMYAIIVSSVLNCILDPVFIYVLGLGSAGASISTVVSVLASASIIMFLILIKKDTYVDVTFKGFKFDSKIALDILKVTIPASFDRFIIPIAMTFYLMFIFSVGGVEGIAIFMSGQRLYLLGILPSTAISIAVSAVSGSAFGAGNWEYLTRAHTFSTKFAMAMSATVMLVLVIFAPQLSLIFAYTPETAALIHGIINFLRIVGFGLIFVGLGMPSSFLYQGIGRGTTSLVWTVIRELIFAVSFTYLFGIVFCWGLTGIWVGLAVGRGVASFLNFVYAKYTIRMLKSEDKDNDIQKRGYWSMQHLHEWIQVLMHQFRHESG